jgi:hypothetical protein
VLEEKMQNESDYEGERITNQHFHSIEYVFAPIYLDLTEIPCSFYFQEKKLCELANEIPSMIHHVVSTSSSILYLPLKVNDEVVAQVFTLYVLILLYFLFRYFL